MGDHRPSPDRERRVMVVSLGDESITEAEAADVRRVVMERLPHLADVVFVPGVAVSVIQGGTP